MSTRFSTFATVYSLIRERDKLLNDIYSDDIFIFNRLDEISIELCIYTPDMVRRAIETLTDSQERDIYEDALWIRKYAADKRISSKTYGNAISQFMGIPF